MADTLAATLIVPMLQRDPVTAAVPLTHLSLLVTINLAGIAGLLVAGGDWPICSAGGACWPPAWPCSPQVARR
ncbi:hypothetical protein ACFQ0B_76105 [Nonomuraea thailandensis]